MALRIFRTETPIEFPDPDAIGAGDVVHVGGPTDPQSLRNAYKRGIFPWPHRGYPMLWFSPVARAILDFDQLHIPESLRKTRKKSNLTFTIDRAFPSVVECCQKIPRLDQDGTWITEKLKKSVLSLHETGDAHSVEAWDPEGKLVGGLYGITAGGYFSGESMFTLVTGASKLCVLHLVEHLAENGHTWLDVQTITQHFALMGAREIPRPEFLARVRARQQNTAATSPRP